MSETSREKLMADVEAPNPTHYPPHWPTVELRAVHHEGIEQIDTGTAVDLFNPDMLAIVTALEARVSILEDVIRELIAAPTEQSRGQG